jgi:DNA-binding transcriptional LysR family regulator
MEIRQLQILRELGERGSVSAVAEALYVTPSAISQQLRLLQATIASPLTARDGRRLSLTDAGKALAAAAAGVETALAKARDAVEAFTDEPGGAVKVAAFHSAAATFFPTLIRSLAHPGAPRLHFSDQDVAQSDFTPLTGDYDIVIAHRLDHSPPWPRNVHTIALLHEPLDVAMPEAHPLASKRRVTPREVAREPWITVQDGFPLLATIVAIGAAAHQPLEVVHHINDFAIAGELVAAGGGLALMPRWTTALPPGVIRRPLTGVHARRHIDALCRPERAVRRSVQAVLQELQQAAKQIRKGPSESPAATLPRAVGRTGG